MGRGRGLKEEGQTRETRDGKKEDDLAECIGAGATTMRNCVYNDRSRGKELLRLPQANRSFLVAARGHFWR